MNNHLFKEGSKIVNGNGNIIRIYDGSWLRGKPHGPGVMQYGDGTYHGNFRDGKLDGEGILITNNGDNYTGHFSNDSFNGQGKFTFANGDYYDGEWLNNNKHGLGTFVLVNNRIYTGNWENNKPSGKGNMNFLISKVNINDGDFKHEIKNGEEVFIIEGIFVYPDGSQFKGVFEDFQKISGDIIVVPKGVTNPLAGDPNFDVRYGYNNKT